MPGYANRTAPAEAGVSGARLLPLGLAMLGLLYPLLHHVAPPDSRGPLGVWIALSLGLLALPLLLHYGSLPRALQQAVWLGLAGLLTLHWFLLAWQSDMHPFYALGSVMSVIASVFLVPSLRLMTGYAIFVASLGLGLYFASPDPRKLVYWGALAPVLLLASRRLGAEAATQRRLESQVAERTLELSEANQRLSAEVDRHERLVDELRAGQRTEPGNRLAGAVAHDLSNLLTAVGVYAELVLAGLPEDSSLRNEVRRILKANNQAMSLARQLVTLGRVSQAPFERINLDDVVSDSARMIRHLLGGEVELDLKLVEGPHPIWANADPIQQILINLCSDSRESMSGAGSVSIEMSRCTRQNLMELDGACQPTADEYVRMSMTDSGRGMSDESRERGGALGLSIARSIVSRAGGHVCVDHEPGRGTRVELFWPLAVGAEPEAEPPSSEENEENEGSGEILLVEDEDELRDSLRRALQAAGYRVTEADCAEGALAAVSARSRRFDLVITDVVMPRVSGIELVQRLQTQDPASRILLISGEASESFIGRVSGDVPFLAKPFGTSELTARVRELVDANV